MVELPGIRCLFVRVIAREKCSIAVRYSFSRKALTPFSSSAAADIGGDEILRKCKVCGSVWFKGRVETKLGCLSRGSSVLISNVCTLYGGLSQVTRRVLARRLITF